MAETSGYAPYAWLAVQADDPDWVFQEALLITFVHGLSPDQVADRLHLAFHPVDLSSDQESLRHFIGGGKALFDAGQGWTVLYEDNGMPHETSNQIAEDRDVDQVVIVFTNVNSVMAFAYWRSGERLLGFEFPHDRVGSAPDALLAGMRATTGVTLDDYDQEMEDGTYLPRLLTLAGLVTGVHLTRDFLRRPLLAAPPGY